MMKISGGWHIDDQVSGLRLTVIEGEQLDHLHIEFVGESIVMNRDFWFDKDGGFDGTGSGMCASRDLDAPPQQLDAIPRQRPRGRRT